MKFDVVIVLANEMNKEGALNPESLSRIELGCKYHFKKPSTFLITCGWDYRTDSSLFIGNVMKSYATRLLVDPNKIISECNSRDTVGDAFFTKINVIKKNEWKKLLVVTSNYHVLRTRKIFEFIYGSSYDVEVIGSLGFDTKDKQLLETKSTQAFDKTFRDIKTGNDKEIYERLRTAHPFYNGNIYSKISILNEEDFIFRSS